MGRAYAKTYDINGITCIKQGLSVSKNKSREHRGMSVICDKNGNIKDIVKNIGKESDKEYNYEGVTYVDFNKDDKFIVCNMYIEKDENGNEEVFMDISVKGYLYYDRRERTIELSLDDDGDTTRIITTYERFLPTAENYNTFDFDNINSYKDFGVYAEAVMTLVQRVRQYKD